jgi:hypothetical protein
LILEIEPHHPNAEIVGANLNELLVELDPAATAIGEMPLQRCDDALPRRRVEVVVPLLGEDFVDRLQRDRRR